MSAFVFLALAIVPIALGFGARLWVHHVFDSASAVGSRAGVRGAKAARRLLRAGGCDDISIETVEGELTDHYDPGAGAVRLSKEVASSASIGALAVVAHEVGHVLQDRERSVGFLVLRRLHPVASFCSYGWLVAIGAGLVLESVGLVALALVLFAGVAAFHVATLPVEVDASRRALGLLAGEGLLAADELPVARRVLKAAALTYLVATLVAIAQLLRIALEIALSGEDD